MTERSELIESALDCLPEGLALVSAEGNVQLWNHAARVMTGYAKIDVLMRPVPPALEPLLDKKMSSELPPGRRPGRWGIVRTQHKQGQEIGLIVRHLVLRDGLGARIGTAVLFHQTENLDELPRGDAKDNEAIVDSQQALEERLQLSLEDFEQGGAPMGVLWISVDQAEALRKTHGISACEAMFGKMQQALAQGLRPTEELGRWGTNEFLVIAHEQSLSLLAAHAQILAGLARTADFRWWGDRISLTVSVGAAQAEKGESETLAQLLNRAQESMEASVHAGGNCITPVSGGKTCLPL
jgi:diguanylate cyclase (GGDEF)-like protein/PAS domain S-box-containing protein